MLMADERIDLKRESGRKTEAIRKSSKENYGLEIMIMVHED